MIELEEIVPLIHDAGVDGHLGGYAKVKRWLDKMTKLDKEILLLVASEYWDMGELNGYHGMPEND